MVSLAVILISLSSALLGATAAACAVGLYVVGRRQ